MSASVKFFDGDLRHVAGGSEDEIGMLNSVFVPVGHADHKKLKWRGVKQLTDFCFHVRRDNTARAKRKPPSLRLLGLPRVVGAPEFGGGARALGAFAGVGVGFDALQGRALAQREQGRGSTSQCTLRAGVSGVQLFCGCSVRDSRDCRRINVMQVPIGIPHRQQTAAGGEHGKIGMCYGDRCALDDMHGERPARQLTENFLEFVCVHA